MSPEPRHSTTTSAPPLDAAASQVDTALRLLAAAPPLALALAPGVRVAGRYVIERRIGRGGMGVVYRAHDRELDRRVALKLHGAPTDPQAGERMMQEARAMARLSHPNVVGVYEVGVHDGQVFIVMEWIDGLDLRAWLAAEAHPRDAIVDRFLAAGEGLAAAHAAGLVHRDFKPANVLVGADGRVRVADFGLARDDAPTLGGAARSATDLGASPDSPTHDGAIAGTPAYMSPEQAAGRPVDPRTDQFSFCVALWEALHGEPPGRGAPRAAPELPGEFVRALRRGLDEQPDARFPDMGQLLDALRPERRRRRRRRVITGATIAGVALASLATGAALMPARGIACARAAWQATSILPDDRRAELAGRFAALPGVQATEAWPRVERALTSYVDALAAGSVDACADTHERGLQSAARLDQRTACLARARRELEARLDVLATIDESTLAAAVPLATGLPDVAQCADPESLRPLADPTADPARVESIERSLAAARARVVAGDYVGASALADALAPDVDALGDRGLIADHRKVAGDARALQFDTAGARERFEAGYLAARAARDEARAGQLSTAIANLETIYLAAHREALLWAKIAGDELARSGDDRRVRVDLLVIEGNARRGLGELTEALARYDAAAAQLRRSGSPRPDHLAVVQSNRGIVLERFGRYDEAIAAQEDALAILRDVLGPHHPKCATVLNLVGATLAGAGRHAEAEARYLESLAISEAAFGADSPTLAPALTNLAIIDGTRGRFRDAIARLERVQAIYEAMPAPNPEDFASSLAMLGEYHGSAGDPARGVAQLDRALALLRGSHGDDHALVAETRMRRAELLANSGDLAGGLAEQLAAAAALERALGPDSPTLADSLTIAGMNYVDLGDHDAAEAQLRRALAIWDRVDPEHFQAAFPATSLGAVLVDRNRAAEALPFLERAVRIREAEAGSPWRLAESRWHLARALWSGGGDRTRAVALARSAREDLAAHPDQVDAGRLAAVDRWLAAAQRGE